jgi:hypothetical protein
MVCDYYTRLLKKKNEIVDCDDTEAIVVFKNGVSDEFLTRDFREYKPKNHAGLDGDGNQVLFR